MNTLEALDELMSNSRSRCAKFDLLRSVNETKCRIVDSLAQEFYLSFNFASRSGKSEITPCTPIETKASMSRNSLTVQT